MQEAVDVSRLEIVEKCWTQSSVGKWQLSGHFHGSYCSCFCFFAHFVAIFSVATMLSHSWWPPRRLCEVTKNRPALFKSSAVSVAFHGISWPMSMSQVPNLGKNLDKNSSTHSDYLGLSASVFAVPTFQGEKLRILLCETNPHLGVWQPKWAIVRLLGLRAAILYKNKSRLPIFAPPISDRHSFNT
jgi:hypothetical protein